MRARGSTVQQALSPEAARVVKEAVNLAGLRGHAQVTPLHVASAMIASTSLLKDACAKTHAHPLHFKALELCLNVALNRLPSSSSTFGDHRGQRDPSLSNALIAAFKRAQAHQRRGSIENHQQQQLSPKVEIEQLIFSILDDPTVSRVMMDSGFSSEKLKTNLEQQLVVSSSDSKAPLQPTATNPNTRMEIAAPRCGRSFDKLRMEDVITILDYLAGRRSKSIVAVGEGLESMEVSINAVMERVNKGDGPESLRDLRVIPLSLSSFNGMPEWKVEQKIAELKSIMNSCWVGSSALVFLADLESAADHWSNDDNNNNNNNYCPVKRVILELSCLVSGGIGGSADNGGERLWFMTFGTPATYMRCRIGRPSLESLWGLHPVHVPDSGLIGSTLHFDSDLRSQMRVQGQGDRTLQDDGVQSHIDVDTGCMHSFSCFTLFPGKSLAASSSAPSWIWRSKSAASGGRSNVCQDKLWKLSRNSADKKLCYTSELTLDFSCNSPTKTSICAYETSCRSFHGSYPARVSQIMNPWKDRCLDLSSSGNPSSGSSDDTLMEMEYCGRFQELSAENLKFLCSALQKRVPWQKDLIPDIVSTVLRCRSGIRRTANSKMSLNRVTWLFFHGADVEGKENVAIELAGLVFGSGSCFTRIATWHDLGSKRSRSEGSHLAKLCDVVREDPHRVFFMEGRFDYDSRVATVAVIKDSEVRSSDGSVEEVWFDDAIVILSNEVMCRRSSSREELSPEVMVEPSSKEGSKTYTFDLNISAENCGEMCSDDDENAELLEAVDGAFHFLLPTADR